MSQKCPICDSNMRKRAFYYSQRIRGGSEGCIADDGIRCVNKECRLEMGSGRARFKGRTLELWKIEFGASFKDWVEEVNNGKKRT